MIQIWEQTFLLKKRRGRKSHRIRPLKQDAGIKHRAYSKRCQKLITDFGAEESFAKAADRMKEHHGVELNPTTVQRITVSHASRAQDIITKDLEDFPSLETEKQMIMEMDGEMVPLVDTTIPEDSEIKDCRKARKCLWAELKIGTAQRFGEIDWKYASSFNSADELGDRMGNILKKSLGWNGESKVYGIGDGATWIPAQFERIAGSNYWYTVDLYHLCEYFSSAASAWTDDAKKETRRLKEQMKKGEVDKVLQELKDKAKLYPEHVGLHDCIRYMNNRSGQFKYDKALEKGLPIGSGKVESSHRHLIQARLKKAGAWWKRKTAEVMANLRVLRANGKWDLLWQSKNDADSKQMAA